MVEQFKAPVETETVKETQEELIERLREKFPGVFQRVEDLRPEGYPIFVEEEKDEGSFEKYAEMRGGTWTTRIAPDGKPGDVLHYENTLYKLNKAGKSVDRADPDLVAVVEEGCCYYGGGPSTEDLGKWFIVTCRG